MIRVLEIVSCDACINCILITTKNGEPITNPYHKCWKLNRVIQNIRKIPNDCPLSRPEDYEYPGTKSQHFKERQKRKRRFIEDHWDLFMKVNPDKPRCWPSIYPNSDHKRLVILARKELGYSDSYCDGDLYNSMVGNFVRMKKGEITQYE